MTELGKHFQECERIRERLLEMRAGPSGSKIHEPRRLHNSHKIRRVSAARWSIDDAMPVPLDDAVARLILEQPKGMLLDRCEAEEGE